VKVQDWKKFVEISNGGVSLKSEDTAGFYDEYYFSVACGRPYKRDKEWLDFFDGISERIIEDIDPKTVLDAGCAMGFLVEALRRRGVEAYGVDISEFAINQVHDDIRAFCWVGSVTDPLPHRYDLIVSIETLEHVPPGDTEKVIKNLAEYTDDFLFSSTPNDFEETTHLNVQPPSYWAEHFARQGYYRDVDYDSSYITQWAVRFRKSRESVTRVIAAYERKLWHLIQQSNAERRVIIRQREEISRIEQELLKKPIENETTHRNTGVKSQEET
jgi:2-polyprenyl-3-methyl-5-hydroxy-6-metoxy-1,4-benzoquinol methylase